MGHIFRKSSQSLIWLDRRDIRPDPDPPRRPPTEESLQGLVQSIRKNGIIQPLTVRRLGGEYRLVAGHRRLRAAALAGVDRLPCVVVTADETGGALLSLLENFQRESPSFLEEADALHTLIYHFGIPREDLCAGLGIAPSALTEKLRLTELTPWQKERIRRAGLSERHARALLQVGDHALRDELLMKVIAGDLTVPQTEKLAEQAGLPPAETPHPKGAVGDWRLFSNTIDHAVKVMRQSGVCAHAEQEETDGYIRFHVTVQKPCCSTSKNG